jgi:ABC-type nitrate/sulfonate/bicarbonate transport system ATPase subunit
MNNKLIEIEGLNLYIGKTKLTSELSLSLSKGERIGITGPSGCGKSTLLKTLIRREFSGLTSFNKLEISAGSLSSYVPQSNGLLPWFSLRKNFQIYTKNTEVFEKVITEFHLKNNLDSFPHQLSGGEYQRAILAAAIVNEPDIFFADEPLTELDISRKWKLLSFWSRKIYDLNASLLLVSHDLETLLYLCDKVIILSDKPSQIKKEIPLQTKHPREKDYLLANEFLDAKKEMLDLII